MPSMNCGSGFAFSLTCPTLPYRWAACRRPPWPPAAPARAGSRTETDCQSRPRERTATIRPGPVTSAVQLAGRAAWPRPEPAGTSGCRVGPDGPAGRQVRGRRGQGTGSRVVNGRRAVSAWPGGGWVSAGRTAGVIERWWNPQRGWAGGSPSRVGPGRRRLRAMLTAGGSGRNGHRRPDACLARPPDSRLLNTGATAGAGPGSVEVLDGTLPSRPTMIGWCGSSMACGLVGHRWRGVAQEGSALLEEALPSSPMNPTVLVDGGSTVGKVIIGTDPHKRSATIEVRDEREILLATGRFGMDTRPATGSCWDTRGEWPQRLWAVEGANGTGRPLAARLLADGEYVVDVPAKLAARIRIFDVGHGRKSDATDAHAITMAALSTRGPRQLRNNEDLAVLRLLADRRDELSRTRAQTLNRLHRLLTELIPGGAPRHLSALQAKALLAGQRPRDAAGRTRRALAAELIGEIEVLDGKLKQLNRRLRQDVVATGSRLLDLFGVGPAGAARILADVGDVARFADRNRFASWTGTAPIDASSGEQIRHRLSRAGNRRMNHVLYIAAVVQIRHDTPGRAYYRRKLAEGKTPLEALRCLRRRLSDVVYRQLVADAANANQA